MKKSHCEPVLPLQASWFHALLPLVGDVRHGCGNVTSVVAERGSKVRLIQFKCNQEELS